MEAATNPETVAKPTVNLLAPVHLLPTQSRRWRRKPASAGERRALIALLTPSQRLCSQRFSVAHDKGSCD